MANILPKMAKIAFFSYKNGHIAIWEDRTLQTDRQAVIIFRDTHFTGEDKTGGTNWAFRCLDSFWL